VTRRAFDIGFSQPAPTSAEMANMATYLAIARGMKNGLERKLLQQVDNALEFPRTVADGISERLASAIEDPIGDASMVKSGIERMAQQQVIQAMQPIVEQALMLGFDLQRLPSVEAHATKRPRGRRRGKGPQADAQPGPEDDPPGPGDDPPGDPPIGAMAGPPGGVFPSGQFSAPSATNPGVTTGAVLPPPPNLSTVPPDYTVLVQRGTGKVVAIPGQPGPEYLGAGYVPIGTAGQLQSIPQSQVMAVWAQILAQTGYTPPAPVPSPVVGMAGPPGGVFPSGTFPAPPPAPSGPVPGFPTAPLTLPPGQAVPLSNPIDTSTIPKSIAPVPQSPQPTPCGFYAPQPPGVPPVWVPTPCPPTAGTVVPGLPYGVVGPATGTSGGQTYLPVAPIGPPSYPGPQTGFPPPATPTAPQPPITWVPGPGGSVLPILPNQPTFPLGGSPPIVPGGVPPIIGGAPLPPGGNTMPFPAPGGLLPSVPGPVPPGYTQPGGLGGPNPAGTIPLQPGPSPGSFGGFPLPGPGSPPDLPPAGGWGTVTIPGASGVPIPTAGQSPPPVLPVAVAPAGPVSPPAPSPPSCPAPNIYLTCPACSCPIVTTPPPAPPSPPPAAPEPEFPPRQPSVNVPPPGAIVIAAPPVPEVPPPPIEDGGIASEGAPAGCLPAQDLIQKLQGKNIAQLLKDAGWIAENNEWKWVNDAFAYLSDKGGVLKDVYMAFVRVGNALATGAVGAAVDTQYALAAASGCDGPDVATAALVQIGIGFIRKWIAELPHALTATWDYYAQWACPVGLPEVEWANEARAQGRLDQDQWSCLVRANGKNVDWQAHDVLMRYEYPTGEDYLSLRRRGLIDDATFAGNMRRLGWGDPRQLQYWVTAHEWVASPSDAIDWMLKDVDDPVIQSTFGLDREFALKYQGQTKAAMDANGVSRQNAENLWRAHWRNMSPTTLYELHKRLRPGWTDTINDLDLVALASAILPRTPTGPGKDQEIAANPRVWLEDLTKLSPEAQGPFARQYLESLATTGFHVFEALGQADYPPFWRDRLLAISYNVLTRVDIRRAYETNQMDQTTLIARLQDRGYTPNDSGMLGGFYREAAMQLAARRPAANSWVAVGYDENLLRQTLVDNGMRPDMWDTVYDRLQVRRKIYIQTKCLTQWKKEFIQKLYTETEIYTRLLGLGMNHEQANQLIKDWSCERQATHKQVMAAALCKQRRQGLITDVTLASGLRDLGYRPRDIRRMIASCLRATPPSKASIPGGAAEVIVPGEG
jgi:hypothetical protein